MVSAMTDLVKRLRGRPAPGDHCSKLIAEAADEIERLRAVDASELGRLRADNLRLVAIIARTETRYQEACQERERIRAELQSVIKEQSDGR